MNNSIFTGLPDDDRRINSELQAMGAFDKPLPEKPSTLKQAFSYAGELITWMRWKGEVGVYGCRVGVTHVRRQEVMPA
ncbi:MAG: hypothetical protein ACPGF7_13275 [Pontibacterium sp.]